MPVYDQGYRRYEARHPLRQVRFWPIVREALRGLFVRKAFLALAAFSWITFVVRLVQVYVVTQFPDAGRVLPVDGRLFGQFLNQQGFFVLLLTVFAGAGLIANDLRSGAIVVYLSRPLTRRDYLLGKLGVLLVVQLLVTLAPALLLWLVAAALAPARFATWQLAWVPPAIVAQSLLMALSLGLACLAISALSRSTRLAGLSFFGLLMLLEAASSILRGVFGRPEWALLSLPAMLRAVGNALFGVQERALELHWALALGVLLAVGAGCLAVLRARVRAVEIVS